MRKFIDLVEFQTPNSGTDKIEMSVPLFIRCLEWAHETAKSDVELHQFVENILAQDKSLDTEDYDHLFSHIALPKYE